MTYEEIQKLTATMPYREALRTAAKSGDPKLQEIDANFDKVTDGYKDWEKQVTARSVLESHFKNVKPTVTETDRTASNFLTSSQKRQNPAWWEGAKSLAGQFASGLGQFIEAPGNAFAGGVQHVLAGIGDTLGNSQAGGIASAAFGGLGANAPKNTRDYQQAGEQGQYVLDHAAQYATLPAAFMGAGAVPLALLGAAGQAVTEIGHDIQGTNRNTPFQQAGNIATAGLSSASFALPGSGIYAVGAKGALSEGINQVGHDILGNNDLSPVDQAKSVAGAGLGAAALHATMTPAMNAVGGGVTGYQQGGIPGAVKGAGQGVGQGVSQIAGEVAAPFKAAGNAISSMTHRTPTDPQAQLKEIQSVVGKIVQGDTKSIADAEKALRLVDTKGVRTYDELKTVLQSKLDGLRTVQDQILATQPGKKPLSDFEKTYQPSKASVGDDEVISFSKPVTMNPVKNALDHLLELYGKTGDPKNYVRIKDLRARAEQEGLSALEVNNIAREYGSQRSGFSPKTGEPLTSVNARNYENTRMALKEASRSLMPDDASKMLDSQMSDLISTKDSVQDVIEKVQNLQNKFETRGLFERAGRLVGRGINKVTFNGLRGFMQSFFTGNIGNKQLNFSEIQQNLAKNLQKFEKLSKQLPSMTDTQAAAAINQFVTETQTGPMVETNSLLQTPVPEGQGSRGLSETTSKGTMPQTKAPVNDFSSAKPGQVVEVPISSIKYDQAQLSEAMKDLAAGAGSKTGTPISVSNMKGTPTVVNGYHRLAEAMQKGLKTIPVKLQ